MLSCTSHEFMDRYLDPCSQSFDHKFDPNLIRSVPFSVGYADLTLIILPCYFCGRFQVKVNIK